MADVLLTSTEEVIQLVSVSGASTSDITTAINAHDASALAHVGTAHTWTAGQTFQAGSTFQQPTAADWTLITIDPSDADALPFYWTVWTGTQAGRDNVGWNLGYNNAATGGPQSATDAAFYLQMETHYNPAADPLFEFHLNAYTANGGASTRPIQINVYKDDLNTGITESFDTLTWTGRSSTPQLMTVLAGATAAASQWVLFMPPVIRVDGEAVKVHDADNNPRVYLAENSGANGGRVAIFGTAPTIDTTIGAYLNFTNMAGVVFPGGIIYTTLADMTGDVNVPVAKHYKVNSVDVIGARVVDARVDDAINTSAWDATTAGVLTALRDAAVAHGWVKAA